MNLIDNGDSFVRRLNDLSSDSVPGWGRMNAHQMLCHCSDALRAAFGELDGKVDQSNVFTRTILKWLVIYVIPIPKGVPTSRRADQIDGDGTPPTEFEADRETLQELIRRFATVDDKFQWSWHFRFGKLDRKEWARFSAKHLDHHFRQFEI